MHCSIYEYFIVYFFFKLQQMFSCIFGCKRRRLTDMLFRLLSYSLRYVTVAVWEVLVYVFQIFVLQVPVTASLLFFVGFEICNNAAIFMIRYRIPGTPSPCHRLESVCVTLQSLDCRELTYRLSQDRGQTRSTIWVRDGASPTTRVRTRSPPRSTPAPTERRRCSRESPPGDRSGGSTRRRRRRESTARARLKARRAAASTLVGTRILQTSCCARS